MSTIKLNKRERDTILAALRYYQNDLDGGDELSRDADPLGEIDAIASDSGAPGLSAHEIDQLYQRINT